LFWLTVGGGVFYQGFKLGKGDLNNPGPGFIFFWMGLIMVGLSAVILILDVLKTPSSEENTQEWSGVHWAKIISVLISLVLYAYFLTFLGFVLCTTALLIFLFKVVEPQRWSIAVVAAISSVLVAYLVFCVWLGSQLPRGFLEIG
jgi:putative tricarboxylic transport membrane protein